MLAYLSGPFLLFIYLSLPKGTPAFPILCLFFCREACDLLDEFVMLYVDGKSFYLDQAFEGTFLPLEVALAFFLISIEESFRILRSLHFWARIIFLIFLSSNAVAFFFFFFSIENCSYSYFF